MKSIYPLTIAATALILLTGCTTSTPRAPATMPLAEASVSGAPRPSETRMAETTPSSATPTSTPPTPTNVSGAPRPAGTRTAETASRATPTPSLPEIRGAFGAPVIFATHAELDGFNFAWGPSDGVFGAIPTGGGNYVFYGTGGSKTSCPGVPKTHDAEGVFMFSGTLDHITGGNGCARLFGPGDAPSGWVFARDYAGGGQVVRFDANGKSGWLMSFHTEYHWKNMANPPSYACKVGNTASQVACFYSSLGLAASTDNGKTFQVAGQVAQPSEPLSAFENSTDNMDVGYGSFIVADANGRHLDNPPADPGGAYFYLFFADRANGLPGACAKGNCMAVARAPYLDLISAAFSGDPHRVARVFRKYDATLPDPWTRPATGDTPDLTGVAGKYYPLWTDEGGYEPGVIYDKSFDVYLAVYPFGEGFKVRTSSDILHWSKPLNPGYYEPGHKLFYPTPIGETDDPTIGETSPRIYFSSFPTDSFPDYKTATFESVPLYLSRIN